MSRFFIATCAAFTIASLTGCKILEDEHNLLATLKSEVSRMEFTPGEIEKCFGNVYISRGILEIPYPKGFQIESCRAAFLPSKSGYKLLSIKQEGAGRRNMNECTVELLACLRPEMANRLATQYNYRIIERLVPKPN